MISIIRFRTALFGESTCDRQSMQALVQSSFENPSFHEDDNAYSISHHIAYKYVNASILD